ncbi:pentatricopeptide repeat-containing protein At3g47530 [Oryza brachyantha]|uniref:DYW domain-containing protein n=1 Tax=Oryza brachyantha TaxID=4533 RepID=J3MTA4_ORYBR|nr:pentatricopeptide repeat-containing protein At3g47530 [Oryza brachyantha]XP_015695869.1 pentatricopeptide repeat-containing protein At3g47530 [Oryza brachyantha]
MASHLARALRPSTPSSTTSAAAALLSSTSPLPAARFLQLHAHVLRTGGLLLLRAPPASASAFLSLAAASLPSPRALSVLLHHITQESLPSTFCCNTILGSLREPDAVRFLRRVRALGRRGNAFSLSIVLKHCRTIGHASQLHANVVVEGHVRDALLATSLMRAYAACGDGDAARKMFDEMPVKDTVAWNVLITCYTKNRRTKDALKIFDEMRSGENGTEPDDVTCILLLQACTSLGALDFGEQVWDYAQDHGYGGELKVRNSLITMYTKCGCMEKAYQVFSGTPNKSVVTWSAMISGLAANGFGKDAISAFEEMGRSGIAPDEQTFTGVLSACSHSGLVDEGFKFFDIMCHEYQLMPNVHHYGCMVDLMGRAGLLNQAYELVVREMRVAPDATIWRTLLGACRVHGHVDLGERVINHLIELKAQQAGDYVLLLNTYAAAEDWKNVAVVRKLMKEKGIQTTPGCTTVEMNGEIHEFIADDDSHPRKAEIYEKLNEINKHLRIAGYVPNMLSELHDLDSEGKECALAYHSEKLAIAFALLVTPQHRPIRLAKNLRVCVDCHNFTKVFSGVYNRLVIVRDRTRFHHFKGFQCSCNDYW